MTQKPDHQGADSAEVLDDLEAQLESADAADAPETAEEIAQLLGSALDDVEGGRAGGRL
jgi:hypothetical protein